MRALVPVGNWRLAMNLGDSAGGGPCSVQPRCAAACAARESSRLFDEAERVLFCSDLLLQHGGRPAVAEDVLECALHDFAAGQQGPVRDSIPRTRDTPAVLARLPALEPQVLAIMHGGCFRGDGGAVMRGFAQGLEQVTRRPV